MSKRVLVLGYWYTDPGMGGVRMRRIARLLPRHGWEPVVLAPPLNPASAVELPVGVRFEAVTAPDLARVYAKIRSLGRTQSTSGAVRQAEPTARDISLTSKLNRWLMIPDKQVPWYRSALRRGREILRHEKVDVIFASMDPRTCLLVAARLAKESGIPSVLEFRDLWTGNPYYHIAQAATPIHRWIHERLERNVLKQAARVSAVCRGIAQHLSEKHASVLHAPIELNYNFFDPDEYPDSSPPPAPGRPFTISYTGALYGGRGPHQFLEGFRAFLDQTGLTPAQCRFRWAGSIIGIAGLNEVLERTRVRPYLDFLGQVPHREALRELMLSDVSLLIQAPNDAIHIPGKLFEAMGARVPLLALANPSETADIITRSRAGLVCAHTAESIAAALTQFHTRAKRQETWDFNLAEVQRFSAKAAVAKLSELFETVSTVRAPERGN